MKRFLLLALLFPFISYGQGDTVYRISLILALQSDATGEKLNDFLQATDVHTANRIRLDEDAIISLDFYEGVVRSLKQYRDSAQVELTVYDCANNDSITQAILQRPELKKQDLIIGSVSTSTAKLVAAFCRENKILNIQPFTPSKSLTTDNPYHIKLAPTIDSHVDALFNSITESFPGANVIIYTPDADNSINIANRFDSSFVRYNRTASKKFTVAVLNAATMMLDGKKTTALEQMVPDRNNILILTSFEEAFVNGNLRMLYEHRTKFPITVYGMPTWMSGDILRLDYLNDYSARVSEVFWLDTVKPATVQFVDAYKQEFAHDPSKYSFLGFDVMNFTMESLNRYGKNFPEMIYTQRYSGTGYKIDIVKNKGLGDSLNYYENRHVNVFEVENYHLKKVW